MAHHAYQLKNYQNVNRLGEDVIQIQTTLEFGDRNLPVGQSTGDRRGSYIFIWAVWLIALPTVLVPFSSTGPEAASLFDDLTLPWWAGLAAMFITFGVALYLIGRGHHQEND